MPLRTQHKLGMCSSLCNWSETPHGCGILVGTPCQVCKGMGSQSVVVCAAFILEVRADSRFYRVLLKLWGIHCTSLPSCTQATWCVWGLGVVKLCLYSSLLWKFCLNFFLTFTMRIKVTFLIFCLSVSFPTHCKSNPGWAPMLCISPCSDLLQWTNK